MRYDKPFYSKQPWREFRAKFLATHPLCAVPGCGHKATHVDHVKARKDGGADFDPKAMMALCTSHHSAKTVALDGGFGRKAGPNYKPFVPGCDANGLPNEPDHHWK